MLEFLGNKVAGFFLTYRVTLTDDFLGILRNFPEQLFLMTSPDDCTGFLLALEIFLLVFTYPEFFPISCPLGTGRKLNVHKMFRRRLGRLMYVPSTSCVQRVDDK